MGTPASTSSSPPKPGSPTRWWWPEPGTRYGLIFYGVITCIMFWLLFDLLPHHIRWVSDPNPRPVVTITITASVPQHQP